MADLKIDITEKLVLNGVQQGGSTQATFSGIKDVYKRTLTIPATSSATLTSFKSTVATGSAAAMDVENVEYIRISNLNALSTDAKSSVSLGLLADTGGDDSSADITSTIQLGPQKSFLLGSVSASLNISSSANLNTTLHNLESIVAKTSGSATIEIFIAST